MLKTEYVFTFNGTTMAMAAKVLTEKMGDVRLIPLFPEIDVGCGLCLKVDEDRLNEVWRCLQTERIEYQACYRCNKEDGERRCITLTMPLQH